MCVCVSVSMVVNESVCLYVSVRDSVCICARV